MNYKEENYMCKQSTFSFQLKKKKIFLLQCKPVGMREDGIIYVGNKSRSVLDLGGQREPQLKFTNQMNCYSEKILQSYMCVLQPGWDFWYKQITTSALLVLFALGVSTAI